MKKTLQPKLIVVAILAAYATPHIAFAESKDKAMSLNKVEVVSTTPLAGVGLPLEQIPSNVQVVKGEAMEEQRSLTIADYMNNNLTGVSINETQNNPYQPDVLFRGFTASPLLGTPQGLSIFQDGVRINEPFGDAVNWDLIPMNAIAGMNLMPGSNPVFGLNTLGGAIAITTKNGRTHQGGGIETSYGSWDRKTAAGEFGGVSKDGSVDYFIAGNYFDEDGWRDASPSKVKQIFSKLGWQNETSRLELSYTGADNNMIGNGLVQEDIINDFGRKAINTSPDQTKNTLSFFNLNGSHFINEATQLSANTYYRKSKRNTLNGDVNDDFNADVLANTEHANYNALILAGDVDDVLDDCHLGQDEDEAEFACSGALNRSNTKQKSYGFNAQLAFNQPIMNKQNQLIVGGSYDESKVMFDQSTEFGLLNDTRSVTGFSTPIMGDDDTVSLHGKTKTYGLFATDTLSLNDYVHLTVSGRYNHTNVNNVDQINAPGESFAILGNPLSDETLTGNHSFQRFNPAVGLSFTPTKDLNVYGAYNEGMRAPTSMELGCANPYAPCKLPNAMAGDPPLEKVVAKTFEAGMRGNLSQDVKWSAAVYRTENHNDIQFIQTNALNGMGYFDNVGKTRRQGLDTNLAGRAGKFSWNAGYSYLKATYQTDGIEFLSEGNSAAEDGGIITVNKGDRLANLPSHAFKMRMQYAMTPNWTVGSNVNAFSSVYMRGNENNEHDGVTANEEGETIEASGKVKGYAVVNMDTRYKFNNSGWQVFAKASNIFNKKYATGGMLGENWFDEGQFAGSGEGDRMLMLGAPRAAWIGMRYDFGKPVATSASVDAD
ncbi:CirA Outer membrane receptor proteins, mostly Fe transport [Methylophilaceae bacterium]